MATNVHLTPELESFARSCVDGGQYNNMSEVIRASLRLLKEQQERRQAFDTMIAQTIHETDETGSLSMDDVLAEVDGILEAARK